MGYFAFSLFSFLLGLILIISGAVNKRKNKRCSAQTQGRWIGTVTRSNSQGSLPSASVYSYYVDGVEYKIKSTAINKNVRHVGDTCPIWYNPKKPKEAQEFHYEKNKTYTIILLVGIGLILLSFVVPFIGIAIQATSK